MQEQEQVIAKRSTGLMVFLLILAWLMVVLTAFAFTLLMIFGETDGDTILAVILGLFLLSALVYAIRETYIMSTIPCVLAKISDGVLYIYSKKKETPAPIDSFNLFQTEYVYYGALNVILPVTLVLLTLGIIFIFFDLPLKSKNGKITFQLNTGKIVKLRYVKDMDILLRSIGFQNI